MSPDLAAMVQPFADEELHTFQGVGGKQLTYIEDETVMDRLDIGFGRGNWSIHVEPIQVYEGVVKVRLSVRVDDGPWVEYEDFGYPNNKGGQALKEAVTDGIRRCGRYLGIARDLYRTDAAPVRATNGHSATPVRQAAPVPARSSTAVPEPPLDWDAPKAKGAVAVLEVDGSMTYGELADRANVAGMPIKALGDASKKLFGQQFWKLTDLTDVQRFAVAVEAGLT